MKNWQLGIELETLQTIEDEYDECFNKYSLSPFTEMNKPKVAQHLTDNTFVRKASTNGKILSYVKSISKVKTKIESFEHILATKEKGDITYSFINYQDSLNLLDLIKDLEHDTLFNKVYVYIWEEDEVLKQALYLAKLSKIGTQFKSTAEIVGVYTNLGNYNFDVPFNLFGEVDTFPEYDKRALTEILPAGTFKPECESILEKIDNVDWGLHYSNYHKGKNTWEASSIQGYSDDITFIEKPKEMLTSRKFAKDYEHTIDWKLQKTKLYDLFKGELESIFKIFPITQEYERIRLMRLKPGGGKSEISRHTDLSDPDIGTKDGKIMRFHIPVITNDFVIFSGWNWEGKKISFNPKIGSMFSLDLRKPHMVQNNGNCDRIHLVCDLVCNNYIRELISKGNKIG